LHWVGIADSPTVYQDSFVHQIEALHVTKRLLVGPVASHVVIRHPVVIGNLLATINELSGGRCLPALATGNSAARGLGLRPSKLAELREGVAAIRSYWDGAEGPYGATRIPSTDRPRPGCPIIIAADGPKTAALAGEIGDGIMYSGTLAPGVRQRRLAAGRPREEQQAWLAPCVSLAETPEGVREDIGALLVAMTNRALRGDLDERGVPAELQDEIRAMWAAYDYSVHADTSKPRNAGLMSDALGDYLVDSFCVWGDEARWRERLGELAAEGWTGVSLVFDPQVTADKVAAVGERLRTLELV
jgi:5,10-methylenetetrahydromethanopterin reductase